MKKQIFAMLLIAVLSFGVFSLAACNGGDKEQTITLEDGSVFVGVVKDGKPNGYGTLTNEMGSEWTGTFVDGVLQGWGKYVGFDLNEYEGEFKDGKFEGYGHRVDSGGNDFKCTYVEGKANGFGRIEWVTGCYYEGGMKNDMMDGMGWMTWPVGDAYFGQWSKGDPNGFGCKVFYDAAIPSCVKGDYNTYNKYVGMMEKNFPHGKGIMIFAGAGVFIGNWEKGDRNDDNGIYYFEEGSSCLKFVGAFSKKDNGGWIWGEGTMWYTDGRIVSGVWEGTTCVEVRSIEKTDNVETIRAEGEEIVTSALANEMMNALLNR